MTSLTLSRSSVSSTQVNNNLTSYSISLEITATQNINSAVFVKQRKLEPMTDSTYNDYFVAVASPVQLEDLAIGSPDSTTSFFRDSKVTIMAASQEYLDTVFDAIRVDLQRLVKDVDANTTLVASGTYTITS